MNSRSSLPVDDAESMRLTATFLFEDGHISKGLFETYLVLAALAEEAQEVESAFKLLQAQRQSA